MVGHRVCSGLDTEGRGWRVTARTRFHCDASLPLLGPELGVGTLTVQTYDQTVIQRSG